MSKDNYQMVEVEKIALPSFMPKSKPPTTELEASITSNGILQPIGICRNDAKELEEYKYLVIWGRKRLLAAQNLNIKRIPAVIIDIKPSKEEFLKYSLMDSQTKVPIAKEMKNYKTTEGVLDIDLIEDEDYGLLKMAEANGLTVNEMIRKILKEKLVKEGLLEEE